MPEENKVLAIGHKKKETLWVMRRGVLLSVKFSNGSLPFIILGKGFCKICMWRLSWPMRSCFLPLHAGMWGSKSDPQTSSRKRSPSLQHSILNLMTLSGQCQTYGLTSREGGHGDKLVVGFHALELCHARVDVQVLHGSSTRLASWIDSVRRVHFGALTATRVMMIVNCDCSVTARL